MEEIHAFELSRVSRTPLLVRITVHPDDKESSEVIEMHCIRNIIIIVIIMCGVNIILSVHSGTLCPALLFNNPFYTVDYLDQVCESK